jgi:hypothetical protein
LIHCGILQSLLVLNLSITGFDPQWVFFYLLGQFILQLALFSKTVSLIFSSSSGVKTLFRPGNGSSLSLFCFSNPQILYTLGTDTLTQTAIVFGFSRRFLAATIISLFSPNRFHTTSLPDCIIS